MKIDKQRVWKALGIGVLLTLPILYVYVAGEGSEDAVLNTMASTLMTPAMILAMPLLLLAPFFEHPDTYVLGAFFYIIPILSVIFYAACTYGTLSFLAKKK
jgi:hypothetical protein